MRNEITMSKYWERVSYLKDDWYMVAHIASLIGSNAHKYAQNYADVLRPDDTIVILIRPQYARHLRYLTATLAELERSIAIEYGDLRLAIHASSYEAGVICESARVRSQDVILLLQRYFRLHRAYGIEYTCTLSAHICYPEIIEEMQEIISTGEWWEAIRGETAHEMADPENDRGETPVGWEIEGPAPMIVVGPPRESWYESTCKITVWK